MVFGEHSWACYRGRVRGADQAMAEYFWQDQILGRIPLLSALCHNCVDIYERVLDYTPLSKGVVKPNGRPSDPVHAAYKRLPASDPERSSIADSDKQINISEHIELGSLQDSHAFNPDNEEAQVLQERKTSKATEDEITFRSILIPRVLLPVINYGFLAFTDQAVQVLIPLMYSSQIDYGGLGFDPFAIGLIQGAAGFVIGLLQILTFPALLRRFGPKKLYIASYASYLLVCCAFPLLAHITNKAGAVNAWSWTIIVLQLAAYAMSCPAWGCIFMYISESAPSSATLGLTNGLAQTTASVMRAIAPSTSSSLFSASLEHNLAGGHMVYWFLCIFTIFGLLAASQLRPHVG